MRHAWIAFAASVPLALLCGIQSLGTVGMAQDRGISDSRLERYRDIFARADELPRDVEMLKSDDTACQGVLVASGLEGGSDVQSVGRGEERVFEVENQNVPWACLSEKTARSGTMICPGGTSHVRITHDADIAKFECYGRKR